MNYDNYMELYEAVYFFNQLHCLVGNTFPRPISENRIHSLGIAESVYMATVRILVVNKLLYYDGSGFALTSEHQKKHRHILDNIVGDNIHHYAEMFNKAVNEAQFLFDSISDLEYEIYSRCNYSATLKTGSEVAKHVDFTHKSVLELGGNSGGLGTALLTKCNGCPYTVVDRAIPCTVGNELKKSSGLNIEFIEGNIFNLVLPDEIYGYIILMNLLHDFDDMKCLNILRGCIKHCDSNTKFLIIEDILTDDFEPEEVVMHGLRLAVYCRGGRQRTAEELAGLFAAINYAPEKAVMLDSIHTMLVMGAADSSALV